MDFDGCDQIDRLIKYVIGIPGSVLESAPLQNNLIQSLQELHQDALTLP